MKNPKSKIQNPKCTEAGRQIRVAQCLGIVWSRRTAAALFCFFILHSSFCLRALGQGTAFTYQGQLQNNGSLANGTFDLKFTLFDTNVTGTAVAGPVTNSGVAISNGLFTVTIDFGGDVWNGESNWLEIAVETNAGSSFSKLSPRQQVTPTPYAITAENLGSGGLSGTYGGMVTLNNPSNQFTGAFTGDGSALTNVNVATLGGLTASNFWQLGGNDVASAEFIGTLNTQPLDLYADGVRAMGLVLRTDASGTYSNAPNVIGGSSINGATTTGIVGVTIAGGGGNSTGTLQANLVGADFGTISGGLSNNVSSNGTYAFIGGGQGNSAEQQNATIGGGFENIANNLYATIGGGYQNTVSGAAATVGGGDQNTSSGFGSTVGGGGGNISTNYFDTVAGGLQNTATGITAGYATIAGGNANTATGDYSVVGGGYGNTASSAGSFIGGGGTDGTSFNGNLIDSRAAAIVGGLGNTIPSGAEYAFIGGGDDNTNTGYSGSLAGGFKNSVIGDYAAVAGGAYNVVNSIGSFIGGGGYDGTNYGGNLITSRVATIGGGYDNYIFGSGIYAFIGGGCANQASGNSSTLCGGNFNIVSGQESFVGGGYSNIAKDEDATVGGGYENTASGLAATVPGGYANTASGPDSFAAGTYAAATHDGSFVWADDENFTYSSSFIDGFFVRCTGGARIVTAIDLVSGNPTAGVALNSGDTAWSSISDRNAKKNFQPVDTVAVLNKLAAVPIEQWNYKWEKDSDTPNIGPMAQDFKAAFYPGRDDKSISTLEFDGVELAAIQGLNHKLEAENAKLQGQVSDLQSRLERLQEAVARLTDKSSKFGLNSQSQ